MRTVTLHPELLSSAKAQSLEGDQFKFWINLLLLCAPRDGRVPEIPTIAFGLRQREGEIARMLGVLIDYGLLEDLGVEGLVINDWHDWAVKTTAPTSTDRVRAYRERQRAAGKTAAPPAGGAQMGETFHGTDETRFTQSVQMAGGKGEEGGDYRGGDRGMGSSETIATSTEGATSPNSSLPFPTVLHPQVPQVSKTGCSLPVGVIPGDPPEQFELTSPPVDDAEAAIEKAAAKARATRAITNEFTVFWAEWPNKENKKRASSAWHAARRRASLEEILGGLRRYIATKPPDRPWMHAATFLNGDRWNDGAELHIAPTIGPVVVDEGGNRLTNWPGEAFGGSTPEAVWRLWRIATWLPPWGPAPPMPGAPRGESGCVLPPEWLDRFWAWHREKQGKSA